jgi:DNA-binding LacI/PurR family transcriptional regulator
LSAVEDYLTAEHHLAVVCQHREDIDRELALLSFFEEIPSLAGIILAPALGYARHTGEQLYQLERAVLDFWDQGVPTVLIDRTIPTDGWGATRRRKPPITLDELPLVTVDNRRLAEHAVERLIDEGHERIAVIVDTEQSSNMRERRLGYEDAIRRRLGREPDRALIKTGVEVAPFQRLADRERFGFHRGKLLVEELISLSDPPTAIFCASYQFALDALAVLHERGIAVPETISLVGVDEVDDLKITEPSIATAYYPTAELGRCAVDRLLALMSQPGDGSLREIPPLRDIRFDRRGSIATRSR